MLQKCRMPPEFLLGVDKLTAFVQPQLNSHRQGQQKLSGRTALPQQCLQIGKCHKDHLMHSICRHVWKYTKSNTAQRASGDFARHLLANFPSEPVSYLLARICRTIFVRYCPRASCVKALCGAALKFLNAFYMLFTTCRKNS